MADAHESIVKIIYSREFEWVLARRKKDRNLFERITRQIDKILREPSIGKPLRYSLKSRRRMHVGSFVLVYEFHNGELRFLDFDHHDKIYENTLDVFFLHHGDLAFALLR